MSNEEKIIQELEDKKLNGFRGRVWQKFIPLKEMMLRFDGTLGYIRFLQKLDDLPKYEPLKQQP